MLGAHKILKNSRRRMIASFLCAIFLGTAFFIANNSSSKADDTVAIPLVAHRGYSEIYPENTLSAFAGAIAADAAYIEFDVQRTKDGVLVIFHDDDMLRICKNSKSISDFTYEELLRFDVGKYKDDKFAKERIPTLEQTLNLLKYDDSILVIEIKEANSDLDLVHAVYDSVVEKEMLDRVIFASFNYDYIAEIKDNDEAACIMYISTMSNPGIVEKYPADYYNLNRKYLNAKTVKAIHGADACCFAYTAKNEKHILNMQSIGVDGVVSDGLNY